MAFRDIIKAVQQRNVVRLKDRAFAANRLAKATTSQSRATCYRVKDAAINALLRHDSAFVDVVDLSSSEAIIGIRFAGGGKLHARVSCLDAHALDAVRRQLMGGLTPRTARP
jgi:hypothetical protein